MVYVTINDQDDDAPLLLRLENRLCGKRAAAECPYACCALVSRHHRKPQGFYSLTTDDPQSVRLLVDYSCTSESFICGTDAVNGSKYCLRPLDDQVGGHTRLQVLTNRFDDDDDDYNNDHFIEDSIICKPISVHNGTGDELRFYQKLQAVRKNSSGFEDKKTSLLLQFIPRFLGVLSVEENKESLESLSSSTIKKHYMMLENLTSTRLYNRPCVLDLKMGVRQYGHKATAQKRLHQTLKCRNSTSAMLGVRLCGMQIYKGKYKYNCNEVDDNCTHTLEDCYLRRDKYWGRGLNASQFRQAVRRFFQVSSNMTDITRKSDCRQSLQYQYQSNVKNVLRYRLNVVRGVLHKLRRLKRVICAQPSMRFYSCSLLIVYEGDNDHYSNRFDNIEPFETPDLEFNKQQHFGEQIHFANNAVSPGIRVPKKRPVSSSSQDSGVGSQDNVKSFNSVEDEWLYDVPSSWDSNVDAMEFSNELDSESEDDDYDGGSSDSYSDSDGEDYSDTSSTKYARHCPKAPVFDVRIIDFANASFSSDSDCDTDNDDDHCHDNNKNGKHPKETDSGPDIGFLTGLRTLIHTLNGMLKRQRQFIENIHQFADKEIDYNCFDDVM